MSKFLIVSFHHGLIPLALRLRREGHEVETIVWRDQYARVWGEQVEHVISGHKNESYKLDTLWNKIRNDSSLTIISDAKPGTGLHSLLEPMSHRLLKVDTEPPPAASDLGVGWWFDGEQLLEPHLLVYDLGAWPGGLGAQVPGGLTMVTPGRGVDLSMLDELGKPFAEELKSKSFKGLVNMGLNRNPRTASERLMGMEAGWPRLHWEAWLSSIEDVGGVFTGEREARPTAKYTVVVPVSLPPWPLKGASSTPKVRIDGLPPALQGWFFYYDFQPNSETHELWTAGLDGLVAVARGEGQTFERARLQAVGLAQAIQFPDKQFRCDVGLKVPLVLAQLEQSFGLVL